MHINSNALIFVFNFCFYRKCGKYSLPENPLSFISSRNVMLLTLITNEIDSYTGFQANVSQLAKSKAPGMDQDVFFTFI